MINPSTQSDLQLTKTDKTIQHRGRTFAIHTTTHDKAESPYVLESKRGGLYALVRNVKTPTLLFGVGLGASFRNLPGWFSDKSGELKSIG